MTRAWPCVDVDARYASHSVRSRSGRRYDLLTVSMPPGTRLDGVDLSGWRYTCGMTRRQVSDLDAGSAVRVGFPPDSPVVLWRVDGRRREEVRVSDARDLCRAVRTALRLQDVADVVVWDPGMSRRLAGMVDGVLPSHERQIVLSYADQRMMLYTRTLMPMLSRLDDDLNVGELVAVGHGPVVRALDGLDGLRVGLSDWVEWLSDTQSYAGDAMGVRSDPYGRRAGDGSARTAGGLRYDPLSNGLSVIVPQAAVPSGRGLGV